jgi:hypothetical protein
VSSDVQRILCCVFFLFVVVLSLNSPFLIYPSLTFILNVLYYIVVDITNDLEGTNISNSNSILNCTQCMLTILILLEYINIIGPGWLNELSNWIT